VDRATFEAGLLKLGLTVVDAALLFEAVDGDGDGAITLGDLNDGTRAAARAEAGVPDRAPTAAALASAAATATRATTPSKRRRCACLPLVWG
jgi:hypothetical protein